MIGRRGAPLVSAWMGRGRGRGRGRGSLSPLVWAAFAGDKDATEVAVFSDWVFAAPASSERRSAALATTLEAAALTASTRLALRGQVASPLSEAVVQAVSCLLLQGSSAGQIDDAVLDAVAALANAGQCDVRLEPAALVAHGTAAHLLADRHTGSPASVLGTLGGRGGRAERLRRQRDDEWIWLGGAAHGH